MRPLTVIVFLFISANILAQKSSYVLAGAGIQKNQKQIEGYHLPEYSPVYNAGFMFDLTRCFSLLMPVHWSWQYMHYTYPGYAHDKGYLWPPPAIPNLTYTDRNLSYESRFRYLGFSLIPCLKIKGVFIGAGIGGESAVARKTIVHITETHYRYDSTGHLFNDGTTHLQEKDNHPKSMGTDWMFLLRAGYRVDLGRNFFLQSSFVWNRSFRLGSINTYDHNGYKRSFGLSIMLLYNVANNNKSGSTVPQNRP